MSLKELTLFGVKDKVQIAIKRIQEFEPPEGYYLAFSGGKDSQVIYELTRMAGVKFDAHFNLTSVDPPELIYFIKNNYVWVQKKGILFVNRSDQAIQIHKPEISMWKLIPIKLMPPTRKVRYCCEYLKECGGIGRIVMTGIRWQESSKRSKRKIIENCYKNKMKQYFNPIIDWTNNDVWDFIKLRKLKYCKLYDEGYTRIGCIMCPMATQRGRLKEMERYPKYYNSYLRAFSRMIIHREEKGLKNTWNTPEEIMNWWIYAPKKENPDQTIIFE